MADSGPSETTGGTEQRDESQALDGGRFLDRRELLQAAAASAAATGLAGCLGGDSGADTPASGDTSTPTPETVVPDCDSYETLDQKDVNGGATIQAGCYRIDSVHAIDSGTLTLEPGVLIQFGEHAGLNVKQGGALQSKGTARKPVFLQGKQAQRGYWQGLRFAGDGTNSNTLEHTVVAHAGSELWAGKHSRAAVLVRKAALDVQGSTLRDNRGKALLARKDEADLAISETAFESNEIPIKMHADLVGGFDPSNTVENNDDDRVTVGGNPDHGKNEISTDQEWRDPGVPFHVTHNLELTGKLAIQQGTTFDFGENVGLDVDGGVLVVAGTDSDPVRFRGDKSTRGYWQGIQFRNTTARNVIGHAILKDAGGELWHGADYSKAGVFVKGNNVEVVLSRSTFANNDVCGVTATGKKYDFTVENCEFRDNVEPLRVGADLLMNVAANNTYSGNDGSYVRVGIAADHAGGETDVVRKQTWRAQDVPYRLNQDLAVRTDLEIAPGTTIEVDTVNTTNPKVTITVPADNGGSLKADASGADEETIVFTGSNKEPGHWGGISFRTENQKNVLRNVVVEYAGGELHNGDLDSKACVVTWASGITSSVDTPKATLQQVTLRESGKHGIYKEGDADLSCSNVSFESISGANIWDAKLDGAVSSCSPT